MQHPDEGTIHSWLDGALSAEEAAQVEAHVRECPQCAAAVAEARGFIAASSRILTALDDVPRGVIPAAAPKKRIDPLVWRIAATIVVVAGGTLLVLRTGGRDGGIATNPSVTAPIATAPVATAPVAAASSAVKSTTPVTDNVTNELAAKPASPIVMQKSSSRGTLAESSPPSVATTEKPAAKGAAADALGAAPHELAGSVSGVTLAGKASASPSAPGVPQRQDKTRADQVTGAVAGNTSAASGYVGTVAVPSQPPVSIRLRGASSLAAIEQLPLKVVGTSRTIGARVTLYEVAPGDTVTFTELQKLQLESVVVTGTTAQRVRQPMEKAAAAARPPTDTAVVSAADSQRSPAAGALMVAPSVYPSRGQTEIANGVTTITWVDATTGDTLKLSGRMPEERLRQIKSRIEREKAAAAAAKKSP